tara:strand:- start:189 stop:917 length:729 start_codon:yes stop_codon:yes gene_type:complete
MSEKKELPALIDLVSDIAVYEKQDKLNFLLNQPVPEKWIKHHPFIKKTVEKTLPSGQVVKTKVPYPYLPIDKVEHLLRKIFKRYRIEVLREGQYFNGVSVTVRVHYWSIVYNEWDFHDGVGAIHLQVKSGSSPSELQNINNGALSMAFPLAKTLAIKDACDHFGEIFGANLNRDNTLSASMDVKKKTNEQKAEEIKLLLDVEGLTVSEDDRMNVERILDQKETSSYDKCITLLNNHLPTIKN